MKIVINPKYQILEEFIQTLPSSFEQQGEIIQNARNQIRKVQVQGYNLNIKRFKKPIFFNRIVYSFFRKPKAYKAYYNALEVLNRGLSTPEPIAYIEERKYGLITLSYFVSIQLEEVNEIRDLYFSQLKTVEERSLLEAFARYSATMHNRQILHNDYSPGNILYYKGKNGTYNFSVVDINRMQFRDIGIELGSQNFSRLFEYNQVYEYIASYYADERGFDIEQCKKLFISEKTKFHAKKHRKKKLKKLFKL